MKAEIGKRYKHYKGGEYTVLALARLETDPSALYVVYRAEYNTHDFGKGTVWLRKQSVFEEDVMIDGIRTARFSKIEE
jgi:hypothetical protein